jgi:hypothetical protein
MGDFPLSATRRSLQLFAITTNHPPDRRPETAAMTPAAVDANPPANPKKIRGALPLVLPVYSTPPVDMQAANADDHHAS